MIGLLQRVTRAAVRVGEEEVAAIGPGILALVGVEREDGDAQAKRLAERILAYRLFSDSDGRMNLSVTDTGGGLLLGAPVYAGGGHGFRQSAQLFQGSPAGPGPPPLRPFSGYGQEISSGRCGGPFWGGYGRRARQRWPGYLLVAGPLMREPVTLVKALIGV